MDPQTKDLFLKILDAIGYSDDKEAFIQKFTELIAQQTVADLITSLPADKQAALKEKASTEKDPTKFNQIFQEYFSQEQIEEASKKAAATAFEDYAKTILPTLNENQKEKLLEVTSSLPK